MNRVILIIAGGLFSIFGLAADQYAFSIDRKVTKIESEIRESLRISYVFSSLQEDVWFSDTLYSLADALVEDGEAYSAAVEIIYNYSEASQEDEDILSFHELLSDFVGEDDVDKKKLDQLYSELVKSETSEEIFNRNYDYSRELSNALNKAKVEIYNVHDSEVENLSQLKLMRQISISLAILMSLLTFVSLALYIRFAAKAALETQASTLDSTT